MNIKCLFGHKWQECTRYFMSFEEKHKIPYKRVCTRCGKEQVYVEGKWKNQTWKESMQEHIDTYKNSNIKNNLKIIVEEIESGELGGKICWLDTNKDECVLCLGACATEEDYYYVCIYESGNLILSSCAIGLSPVEDKNVITEKMKSLVNDINEHPLKYAARIMKELEDSDHLLFTKLMTFGIKIED